MPQKLNIAYSPEQPNLLLDAYLPEKPCRGTLVFFHGGGLESGSREGFEVPDVRRLTEAGFAVVKPDYRMYPDARFPDYVIDAAAAVAWTKRHAPEWGGERLFVGGSSAGGYLSQMLCFDGQYLAAHGMTHRDIHGWIFDAGQPAVHYNIMRERGIHPLSVRVDEAAPLYFVGPYDGQAPMLIFAAEHDMPGRLMQNRLLIDTMENFGYPKEQHRFCLMEGFRHCEYNAHACYDDEIQRFLESL